jgi:hypothetical protein
MSQKTTAALSTSAFVLDASVTKQQLADYANAILAVNNYAFAITQQQMPVLNLPPPNYAQFTADFQPAKQHAIGWTDSIMPMMLQLPLTITNSDSLFSLDDMLADGYLTVLIGDPTNATALAGLQKALTAMKGIADAQIATIANIQTQLSTFDADIIGDASTLSNIATQALEDAGTDQDTISNLTTKITNLNADIANLNHILTISEIGIGVSIFVAIVGVAVCFIPGAQVVGGGIIALGVVGLAASIAGTVITTKMIKADQASILADQKQISELHQDIIMLQALNAQFGQIVNLNALAQKAMTTVLGMWTDLSAAIGAVKAELATVSADLTPAHYQQAQADLAAADAAWKEVVQFASALNGVRIQWQDASGTLHDFVTSPVQADTAKVNPISNAA